MPWTFSHPAAVLPLRRLCPRALSFPALVAGSLAPDFGLYIGAAGVGSFAHTLRGSFAAALPVGLALLALFYLVRRPLWYLLPEPHRGLLAARALAPLPGSPWHWPRAAASVLLGAWTHIGWDSFTHAGGWAVKHLPFLHGITGLLQHASTVLGAAVLFAAYRSWLKRSGEAQMLSFEATDRWRYKLLAALALLACSLAVLWAVDAATVTGRGFAARVFVVNAAVYGAAVFGSTLITAASLCYAWRGAPATLR